MINKIKDQAILDTIQDLKENDQDLNEIIILLIDFVNEIQDVLQTRNLVFGENLDEAIKMLRLLKRDQDLTISILERLE